MSKLTHGSGLTLGSNNTTVTGGTNINSNLIGISNNSMHELRFNDRIQERLEIFEWLVNTLPDDMFPVKLDIGICQRCQRDSRENTNAKSIYCPVADKILFIWRDTPPRECKYLPEQTVSLNKNFS